jgi:hypothetical protein
MSLRLAALAITGFKCRLFRADTASLRLNGVYLPLLFAARVE